MRKNDRKLFSVSHSISLTTDEREGLEQRIQATQQAYPLAPLIKVEDQPRTSHWLSLWRPALIAVVICAVIITGGGTAVWAAEDTVPGDVLYWVKIHVTENVRTIASVTPTDQATWQAQLIERRLAEAETLASDQRLSDTVASQLVVQIGQHAARAEAVIGQLSVDGHGDQASALSSTLEATLHAHAAVMIGLNQRLNLDQQSAAVEVLERIAHETQAVAELRSEIETTAMTTPAGQLTTAAERLSTNTYQAIIEARKLLERYAKDVSPEVYASATRQLAAAEQAYATATQALKAGQSTQAFVSFQAAGRNARQAKVLILTTHHLPNTLKIAHDDELTPTSTQQKIKDDISSIKEDLRRQSEKTRQRLKDVNDILEQARNIKTKVNFASSTIELLNTSTKDADRIRIRAEGSATTTTR